MKYKVTAALLAVCVIGIVINFRVTERYVDHTYVHSLKAMEPSKAATIWSHLMFYAASHKRDLGVTFKPRNISDGPYDSHDGCLVPRLDNDTEHPPFVTCKRPHPIKGSCEIAKNVFFSEPTPTCAHQKTHIICKIQSTLQEHHVDCSNNICKKKSISMGVINFTDGTLSWKQMQNIALLEDAIRHLLERNESNGNYGFCFLNCTLKNRVVAQQLLLLPKYFTQNKCKRKGKDYPCSNAVNINVIWLDSTSHSHFYRSMPKSVQTLRTIKNSKRAHVFSYNLMQSMSGGTYVNTVAFTSGEISQRMNLLKYHTGIGNLFSMFQKVGYHVTWIDDLCWTWSIEKCACGIPKFLGLVLDKKKKSFAKPWKNIQSKLLQKGVDQIDISLSNCEIMSANNITDPFHTSNNSVAICYNGLYQTDYIMSSMEMLQTQLSSVKRPFFHYLDLNLGHEASGRRIQTLDGSLAQFVEFVSRQNDTLTLIFGDHGNKYGTFVKQTKESKIEMAHTALFVLASNNLLEKLGKDKMDALDINQNRLVNILDLRHTLLTLVPGVNKKTLAVDKKFDVHPNGLFHPISPKRSCESMGISPEAGRCICHKGQVNHHVLNNTRVVVLADYALGEINNKIQEQFMFANSNRTLGFGNCQRLVGRWISEVQETIIENVTVTEMNIHVPAGSNAPQTEDIFSVVVHVTTSNTPNTSSVRLVHYERITTYAVYDYCRDERVDGDICVCSPSKMSNQTRHLPYWHLQPQVVFGHMTTVISLDYCLFIHERRTPYGLILELSCDCVDTEFQVVVYVVRRLNVVSSITSLSFVSDVKSGMMLFIGAFHQLDPLQVWELDYDVKFRIC